MLRVESDYRTEQWGGGVSADSSDLPQLSCCGGYRRGIWKVIIIGETLMNSKLASFESH